MNHVLHLMLMGLGREGSISIAYLILLSHIPLDCAFGWRCRGRGPCRCVYARPNDAQYALWRHFRPRSPSLRTTQFRSGVGYFDVSHQTVR